MTEPLPLGILIPTLNARERLVASLASLQAILGLAQEVVVVDSESQDGTLEFLRAHLHHPHLRFLTHPRGLYESWNFGLWQLTAQYAYIATAGESITPAGLLHLLETAETLESDVVISRPEFVTAQGRPVPRKRWPIHDLLDWQRLDQPARLEPLHVFLLSALDAPECLLGSSASNLYRTNILHRFPFPTDYGHLGDGAWSIRNAFRTSWAVTPEVCSQFSVHPSGAMMDDFVKYALVDRLDELASKTLRQEMEPGKPIPEREIILADLCAVNLLRRNLLIAQEKYDRARDCFWPWILNPRAWLARSERNRQRVLLRQTKDSFRRKAGLIGISSSDPPEARRRAILPSALTAETR